MKISTLFSVIGIIVLFNLLFNVALSMCQSPSQKLGMLMGVFIVLLVTCVKLIMNDD